MFIDDGECSSVALEGNSLEAIELSCEIWGYDPAEVFDDYEERVAQARRDPSSVRDQARSALDANAQHHTQDPASLIPRSWSVVSSQSH